MRSHKNEMYVANTLQYIDIIKEKEQVKELNIMINYFRSNNI